MIERKVIQIIHKLSEPQLQIQLKNIFGWLLKRNLATRLVCVCSRFVRLAVMQCIIRSYIDSKLHVNFMPVCPPRLFGICLVLSWTVRPYGQSAQRRQVEPEHDLCSAGHCRSFILPEECDYLRQSSRFAKMGLIFLFLKQKKRSLLELDDPVDNAIWRQLVERERLAGYWLGNLRYCAQSLPQSLASARTTSRSCRENPSYIMCIPKIIDPIVYSSKCGGGGPSPYR